jgi:hypothetical protein
MSTRAHEFGRERNHEIVAIELSEHIEIYGDHSKGIMGEKRGKA